jgi:hypothetical protein
MPGWATFLLVALCGVAAAEERPCEPTGRVVVKVMYGYPQEPGRFVIDVQDSWSPHSAERFRTLVSLKFFDGIRFHRVHKERGLTVFGIHANTTLSKIWRENVIPEESGDTGRAARTALTGTVAFSASEGKR